MSLNMLTINRTKTKEDGRWFYSDPDEQSLASQANIFWGFDLAEFDTFLLSLIDTVQGKELAEWRNSALDAFKSKNNLAVKGWLAAMNVAWFWSRREDFILPLARDGKNWADIQRNNGFKRHEPEQKKHENWRRWQAAERDSNPNFGKLPKQEQARRLKKKHGIKDGAPTVAKRLDPQPKK